MVYGRRVGLTLLRGLEYRAAHSRYRAAARKTTSTPERSYLDGKASALSSRLN
jgi:hypothetical protein